MESNEREAKLNASSRQHATHGHMDDSYHPIRASTLLMLRKLKCQPFAQGLLISLLAFTQQIIAADHSLKYS